MKSLTSYIQEKLVIKKSTSNKSKVASYTYFPETKEELKVIISQRIKDEGNEVDLNDIDVSKITDMSCLFYSKKNFNGDISNWDVSNVTNMSNMFYNCNKFNQDISNWDVSNVTDMYSMFCECSEFDKDVSAWNVSNVKDKSGIFNNCPI